MPTQMASAIIGRTCPFCQSVIKPGETVVECNQCHTIHHEECWDEHGECTTPGCRGASRKPGRSRGRPRASQMRSHDAPNVTRASRRNFKPFNRRAYGISTDKARRIMALAESPEECDWYLAGLASRGWSWLVVGIPLYFNIISNYLVFTTTGMIIATQTLWTGIKPKRVVAIPYEFISSIEIKFSKWTDNKMHIRYVNGATAEIEIKNREFAKAITETAGDYVSLTIEE